MRDIFEALGATVKFDKASQTVYGQKGATAIILPLGALTATRQRSAAHAAAAGAAYQRHDPGPPALYLRGAGRVRRLEPGHQHGDDPDRGPAPCYAARAAVPDNGVVTGQVTGIYTNTTPTQLTLRVGGENTVVPLAASTIILRSTTGQPATEAPLSAIKPGDQVTVQRGDNGVATIVTATFGEVKGTIVGIGKLASGNSAITLDSGRVVELTPDAPVTFGGLPVALSDLKTGGKGRHPHQPGQQPGLRRGRGDGGKPRTRRRPAKRLPRQLAADRGATTVEVTSFTTDAAKPLRAGDTLTATLAGTPGGKATFSIPGVAEDIPMRETSPGVYDGHLHRHQERKRPPRFGAGQADGARRDERADPGAGDADH